MARRTEGYKCEICGNIVEVLHGGRGRLVCCGQSMMLLEEKTEEQGMEKHLPVTEVTEEGIEVKVGSVLHPMEERHYIEWADVITRDGVERRFLKLKGVPEAAFRIEGDTLRVRAYCNIHGLWTKKEA